METEPWGRPEYSEELHPEAKWCGLAQEAHERCTADSGSYSPLWTCGEVQQKNVGALEKKRAKGQRWIYEVDWCNFYILVKKNLHKNWYKKSTYLWNVFKWSVNLKTSFWKRNRILIGQVKNCLHIVLIHWEPLQFWIWHRVKLQSIWLNLLLRWSVA